MSALGRLTRLAGASSAALFVALAVITEVYLKVGGLDVFDARFFGYGPQEARAYLSALESSGNVGVYLGWFRRLDTVFPLLLTATFLGVIWLNTKGRGLGLRLLLSIPPLVYLFADLLENARVAGMLLAGEGVTEAQIAGASAMTQLKWACVALSILTMLVSWAATRRAKRVRA